MAAVFRVFGVFRGKESGHFENREPHTKYTKFETGFTGLAASEEIFGCFVYFVVHQIRVNPCSSVVLFNLLSLCSLLLRLKMYQVLRILRGLRATPKIPRTRMKPWVGRFVV
jgi:hypothetical protein